MPGPKDHASRSPVCAPHEPFALECAPFDFWHDGAPHRLHFSLRDGELALANVTLTQHPGASACAPQGDEKPPTGCEALDLHARDATGRTPLHWAAASGRPDAGAPPWARDECDRAPGPGGDALRGDAAWNALVDELLEVGASPNVCDSDGRTPLALAAEAANAGAVALLRAAGAVATTTDRYGVTPLEAARRCGDRAVLDAMTREDVVRRDPPPFVNRTKLFNVSADSFHEDLGRRTGGTVPDDVWGALPEEHRKREEDALEKAAKKKAANAEKKAKREKERDAKVGKKK